MSSCTSRWLRRSYSIRWLSPFVQHLPHPSQQIRNAPWLVQELHARRGRFQGIDILGRVSAHEQYPSVAVTAPQLPIQLHATHAGHHHVADHQIERVSGLTHGGQRSPALARLLPHVSETAHPPPRRPPDASFIVHHENALVP